MPELTGIYTGGYSEKKDQINEGKREALEDEKNPVTKDMLKYSHYGVRGQDDKKDFDQPAPSNPHKNIKFKKRPTIDLAERKRQEKYWCFDAETLYTKMPDEAPKRTLYKVTNNAKNALTPEETAFLKTATKKQMYFYGYHQLPKKDLNKELDTLYTIDNDDLTAINTAQSGGFCRSGYLKQFIIDKVRRSRAENKPWYLDTEIHHENEREDTIFVPKSRILPNQFDELV